MKKEKETFNPDDFFTTTTVKDIVPKFEHLYQMNFKEISLNNELVKLNYEIISKEYKDFMSSSLADYYDFEVDEIV
jgi:type VI protein secretion system component Hcp